MTEKHRVKVTLLGQTFTATSNSSEEIMQKASLRASSLLEELSEALAVSDQTKVVALALYQMALAAEEASDALSRYQQQEKTWLALIDQELA